MTQETYTREEIVEIFSNPNLFSKAWTEDDILEQLDRYDENN